MAARFESKLVEIENSIENVFAFLSDFNNFEKLMPPQVTNWKATHDECSFTISGMASLGMKIIEKTPSTLIKIESLPGKIPFTFHLFVQLTSLASAKTQGQLVFDSADMNPMVRMMVEKPLKSFFDLLVEKMKDIK